MIKLITFSFIPGVMFGIEFSYDQGFVVLDLGIFRICFDYWGISPEE